MRSFQSLHQAARRLATPVTMGGAPLRAARVGFAARAWLVAPVVHASLAVAGFQRTLRWIEVASRPRARDAMPPLVTIDEGRALVEGACRAHWVGDGCLPTSLVQYLLHRRDGLHVRLVVGVKRPRAGEITAHAWVEGTAAPAADQPFTRLFEAAGAA